MKLGTLISIVVATLAVSGMVIAFLSNASPYVSVAEAKASTGDDLHLAGDLDKATLETDVRAREVRFTLKDEKGESMPVVYSGAPIANMGEATKVVAVGKCENGVFKAHRLLVKCPSKYEATNKAS